jgi:hypothetical protein
MYSELLGKIESAVTSCELEELRPTIAQCCDNGEITESEYTSLRREITNRIYDLPTQNALDAAEREDLEQTYYEQIKLR